MGYHACADALWGGTGRLDWRVQLAERLINYSCQAWGMRLSCKTQGALFFSSSLPLVFFFFFLDSLPLNPALLCICRGMGRVMLVVLRLHVLAKRNRLRMSV